MFFAPDDEKEKNRKWFMKEIENEITYVKTTLELTKETLLRDLGFEIIKWIKKQYPKKLIIAYTNLAAVAHVMQKLQELKTHLVGKDVILEDPENLLFKILRKFISKN